MSAILVLKIGTANLMTCGSLDPYIFNDIARQLVAVESAGKKVLIVSSGAIQAGRERARKLNFKTENLSKKDLAGLGARHLLNMWGDAFNNYSKDISQFWLTFTNWQNVEEIKSIKTGVLNCFNNNLTPVVNENDVISDTEIMFMEKGIGENDRLARMVATMIEAEGILFLTDMGGVFEEDPRVNPQVRKYKVINPLTFKKDQLSDNSDLGRGGIKTKIEEATGCFMLGMRVSIASTEDDDVLIKFNQGEHVGTTLGKSTEFW